MGAAAAGGTFAWAGYFASRVMPGHLSLFEAYPALPLLLWLVDRAQAPESARRHRLDLGVPHFRTRHPLCDQQHSLQPMVVL